MEVVYTINGYDGHVMVPSDVTDEQIKAVIFDSLPDTEWSKRTNIRIKVPRKDSVSGFSFINANAPDVKFIIKKRNDYWVMHAYSQKTDAEIGSSILTDFFGLHYLPCVNHRSFVISIEKED